MSRRNQNRSQNARATATAGAGAGLSGTGSSQQSQEGESTDPALLTIHYAMRNALELVDDLMPHCPTEEDKKSIPLRLQALMLKFIKAEMSYLESENMVDQVAAEVRDDESMDDNEVIAACGQMLPNVEARVKLYEESLRPEILKGHQMYKTLMKELGKYQVSDDILEDSIMTDSSTSEHIPTIDPITKKKLTDPVRNKICKHIYGHAAILQMIKKSSKIKCPTMGCSNNTFIKVKHLAVDPELTACVQKKQTDAEHRLEEEEDA